MLNSLQKKRNAQSGFTIIEVLIVLAIAGLILLVVFLAVPALQRNAHNTTKKSDVAGLLGAMTEYVSNNNGSLPTATSSPFPNSVKIGVGPTNNLVDVKLGNFDGNNVTISSVIPAAGSLPTSQDSVVIYLKATCSANAPTASTTARNFAAYYVLEGGAKQCSAS